MLLFVFECVVLFVFVFEHVFCCSWLVVWCVRLWCLCLFMGACVLVLSRGVLVCVVSCVVALGVCICVRVFSELGEFMFSSRARHEVLFVLLFWIVVVFVCVRGIVCFLFAVLAFCCVYAFGLLCVLLS